ncbi:MAG: lipocalin-like domain-containing protein [Longimicrobiales bacterium]
MARPLLAIFVVAAIALFALALYAGRSRAPQTVRTTLSLADVLVTGDTAGYAMAAGSRDFRFPDDHASHPGFRTEWWYVTGHLETEDGRRFGYQLTFFRSALAPPSDSPERLSAWSARQAWMAHFALSDAEAGRFHAFERFARGALGLAGVTSSPLRVHVEDWSIESVPDSYAFPVRLRAADGPVAIDLILNAGKPPVLHGGDGLSRKGPEPGNASWYYSLTRMPTTGTVRIEDRTYPVSGSSWLDREWSTNALRAGLDGWDWFALQLDDGSELMLYRLRRAGGATDPFSAGTFSAADGTTFSIAANEFTIESTASWASPIGGTEYPSAWRIRVPALEMDLELEPLLSGQELDLTIRYWEGAVGIRGVRERMPVHGRGFVEMTGYAPASGARGVPDRSER